jgi:hypothetical protein
MTFMLEVVTFSEFFLTPGVYADSNIKAIAGI